MGVERAILIILAIVLSVAAVMVVKILQACTFTMGFLPVISCGGFTLEIKQYFEEFQEIPFKADFAVYTFLKTKKELPVDACVKYLDCLNGTESGKEICKEFYGPDFEEGKCEQLIRETLEKIWNKKIRLTFSGYEFVANEGEKETVNPIYTVERKIFIPYPARSIVLKFEVW